MKLDRKRPFGEVIGSGDGRRWEQDDRFFDANEEEIPQHKIPEFSKDTGSVAAHRESIVEAVRQMGGIHRSINK